ncbi:MAG TPA: single-stranded-DNA-specific exonuclease RecJ [Patescibacteria group bacterium]|nr:single-stranded-DNA-specific exonuclease RecJ [Patescibacteria group bacterium]
MKINIKKELVWKIQSDLTEGVNSNEEIINKLLEGKGYGTTSKRNNFLNPPHPKQIKLSKLGIKAQEMQKAVKRLTTALEKKERITVFGDYDADGICSTAIVWEALDDLGFLAMPHIPKREDGYGIKKDSLDQIMKKYPDTKIIITVDNGIVAHDAVSYANKLGINVIVLDHHEVSEKYPDAYALIYTKKLCGAAISYFFARELKNKIKGKKSEFPYHDPIDLAAIGTVADQMQLVDVNRAIVKSGLSVLRKTNRIGLTEMFKEASIDKSKIGTYEINYVIAPRINAMGRLDEAMESLRLICARSFGKARSLSGILGETNRKRQSVVEKSTIMAFEKLENYDFSSRVIILGDESFHEGVIGLIASKLTEKYYLPSIVFSIGKEISKASARSIKGFNINANIRKLSNLTEGGGGHEMAAGFSIKNNNLKIFEKEFKKLAKVKIKQKMLEKRLLVNARLNFNQINLGLAQKLLDFEPYGIGNSKPVFVSQNVTIQNSKKVGSAANHMKLTLNQTEKYLDAIYFNFGSDGFLGGTKVKAAYQIDINTWDNRINLQLLIKDIKPEI